mgnify:CR=1 FL=1
MFSCKRLVNAAASKAVRFKVICFIPLVVSMYKLVQEPIDPVKP